MDSTETDEFCEGKNFCFYRYGVEGLVSALAGDGGGALDRHGHEVGHSQNDGQN